LARIDIRELIEAGFHFGHRTSRWNPKMQPYIFKKRNLIHIIDLRQTLRGLIIAGRLAHAVARQGKYVLFTGTKRQAQDIIQREAGRCAMPNVAERWPGGLLTNYVTIRSRLERLRELEDLEETGQIELYSKKMIASLRREERKIQRNLGGVREMAELPGLVVIVDPVREYIAAKEARKLGIPSVALVDTDGDPENVDVVVPGVQEGVAAESEQADSPPERLQPVGAEDAPDEPAAEAPEPEGSSQAEETVAEPAAVEQGITEPAEDPPSQ